MYLGGYPVAHDRFGPIDNQGADPADCRAAGGIPSYTDFEGAEASLYYPGRRTKRTWKCQMPTAPRQQPQTQQPNVVTVTVPTTVQTQVNPQISPTVVQQDEPKNSPIGVDYGNRPVTVESAPDNSGLIDLMKQLLAQKPQEPQQPAIPDMPQIHIPTSPSTPDPVGPGGTISIPGSGGGGGGYLPDMPLPFTPGESVEQPNLIAGMPPVALFAAVGLIGILFAMRSK